MVITTIIVVGCRYHIKYSICLYALDMSYGEISPPVVK